MRERRVSAGDVRTSVEDTSRDSFLCLTAGASALSGTSAAKESITRSGSQRALFAETTGLNLELRVLDV